MKAIAIMVLIAGIIFSWVSYGIEIEPVSEEISDLQESYDDHKDGGWSHYDESCSTCDEYKERIKELEGASTVTLMDTLGECLWYVIGCGLLYCAAKVADNKQETGAPRPYSQTYNHPNNQPYNPYNQTTGN